jgi:hypothetical protein
VPRDLKLKRNVAVDPRSLGTLLVCSVRYSVGRRTYMPGLVADLVRRHWHDIDQGSRETLRRDVDEAIADEAKGRGSLGDACDRATWLDLAAWMRGQVEAAGRS